MKGQGENYINFRKYTEPILEVLQKLGIDARFEGRNDLTIDGKKFSGNAMHIWNKKILSHGTLLFSSHMPDLSQALNADPLKFTDKAVKSIRSRVTNISDHLKEPLDVIQFSTLVEEHIMHKYPDVKLYELSEEDHRKINHLVEIKYNTWAWNFGYSPQYDFRKIIRTKNSGTLEFNLNVSEGQIQQIKIFGDYFNIRETEEIEDALTLIPHREDSIREALKAFTISEYFNNITMNEFIEGMF